MKSKEVTCTVGAKVNVLNLKSDGTMADQMRSQSHSPKPKVDTTPNAAAAVVSRQKQRVRRSANANEEPDVAALSKKRGFDLNCTSAQCVEIKCTITELNASTSKTIAVRSVLWKPSLILDYPGT